MMVASPLSMPVALSRYSQICKPVRGAGAAVSRGVVREARVGSFVWSTYLPGAAAAGPWVLRAAAAAAAAAANN